MTRNDYFLDWIFESFQSLLVPCVGLSIIWHLQTDKLRGLSRELVTTPPTYYQVWWTFIILILWSEFSESESPICHLLTLLVSRVDLFQDNNCPLYAKQTPDTLEMKKVLKFATISPQKDFTAEACCCYFLLAQHSEVPQNSTHLSIWNYFFSWKKHFRNHFIWDLNIFWSASKFSTVILNSGNGRFELLTLWRHKFTIQNHIWPWNRMRNIQNYNLSVPLDKRYKHIS